MITLEQLLFATAVKNANLLKTLKIQAAFLLLALGSFISAQAQSFLREIDINGQQKAALVITMPDMGALYAIPSEASGTLVLLRYDQLGTKLWERDITINGGYIDNVSEMKLHETAGQKPKILISGNGKYPWFASFCETGRTINPIALNFLIEFEDYRWYGSNNFTILRSNDYMVSLSHGGINTMTLIRIDASGRTSITYQNATLNGSGFYLYDLKEDPTVDNVIWFCGAFYSKSHESVIGIFNAGDASAKGLAPFHAKAIYASISYIDSLGYPHTNNAIDRIGFATISGKMKLLAIGHVNTINHVGSRNLTLQVLDPALIDNPGANAVDVQIISLGSSISSGEDMGRFHLRPWLPFHQDSLFLLSGYGRSMPFIGIVNPSKQGFSKIYAVPTDKVSKPDNHIPAYFDIADSGNIWIGTEYSANTNRNAFTGKVNLMKNNSCLNEMNPRTISLSAYYKTLNFLNNNYRDSNINLKSTTLTIYPINSTSRTLCENGITNGYVSTEEFDNKQGSISLFPNPASDKVNLSLPHGFAAQRIQILDLNGRVLQDYPGDCRTVSIKQFPSGVYLVQVIGSGKILQSRLIKQEESR